MRARVAANLCKVNPPPALPGESRGPGFFFVSFFVYILAGQRNGALYLGYTDDIFRRVTEHKAKSLGGFTAKYTVDLLVCEYVDTIRIPRKTSYAAVCPLDFLQ